MNDRRASARKAPLRPGDIIDTALELTGRCGLDGWGVRDINHHVGGKDEIARRVVERVLEDVSLPPEGPEWREWFIAMLLPLRARLSRWPGVAHWMLMHGPVFPALMPMLDVAIDVLRRAGFGDETGKVYATIFNAALASIAMADDRRRHAEDGPRDHASIMTRLQEHSDGSPGGEVILETLAPFAQGGRAAQAAAEDHYLFLLTSLLDGVGRTRARPGPR